MFVCFKWTVCKAPYIVVPTFWLGHVLKNDQNQSRTQNSARILAEHECSDCSAYSVEGAESEHHFSHFWGSAMHSGMLVHKIAKTHVPWKIVGHNICMNDMKYLLFSLSKPKDLLLYVIILFCSGLEVVIFVVVLGLFSEHEVILPLGESHREAQQW